MPRPRNSSRKNSIFVYVIALFLVVVFFTSLCEAGGVRANYLYNLSNFSGPIPFQWATLFFDEGRKEMFVIDKRAGNLSIFNTNGMEIYRFGEGGVFGSMADGAVDKEGHILILSKRMSGGVTRDTIIRCNFHGEPLSEMEIRNLPPQLSDFSPGNLFYRENRIYLVDRSSMKIVVADEDGNYETHYDVPALLDLKGNEKKKADTGIFGFSVDKQGCMLFTIPGLSSGFKLGSDGKISGFGVPGGAPGKFGIPSGIVSDDKGFIYVSDQLRCVVLVFDQDLKFQTEFGHYGHMRGNLISPKDLAMDNDGRVYVSQSGYRGVSVFRVTASD